MPTPPRIREVIRELEQIIQEKSDEIVGLQSQLTDQGIQEDLHAFVQKIAKTKSKFAAEARKLLSL